MAVLLTVNGLTKRFGSTLAVDGLGFTIEKGRCAALLGPNGAGKTTTLNMLCGLLEPTAGRIGFSEMTTGDIRKHIGYMPQSPVFFNWMTGNEFMHFVGKLFGLGGKEIKRRTDELLELMGLKDAAKRRIGGYSGGMKQRLGFAQAMINRPELLILDEPVSALDPVGRRELLELLKAMKQETTILFSTHVLHDADDLCDDILIMKQGRIALAGTLDELRQAYRKPLVVVESEASLTGWADEIRDLAFVQNVNVLASGKSVSITVTDMDTARSVLMMKLAEQNLPVLRFEAAYASLESLFLEVVEA